MAATSAELPARDWDADRDWDGVRLHIVTGKGGTGKTTVAAALAISLATGGKKVLLVEVEGRAGLAPLFDVPATAYAEDHAAVAPGGGEVVALSVEPEAALLEYLDLFYRMGRAGKLLERMGAIDFATTIAPGLRDVLLTGKVYEAARRKEGGRRVYDAVVLDAPPTGRIGRFLGVTREVVGLAKMGPVHHHAKSIMNMLRSPETAVHLVTILEEMPVQETADSVAELRAAGLPLGGVVINQVREAPLGRHALNTALGRSLDRGEVLAGLHAAGLGGRPVAATDAQEGGSTPTRLRLDALADGLLAEAQRHTTRLRLEAVQRDRLSALERPTYELPAMPDGVDLGTLYEFAGLLREQGLA